MLLLLWTVSIPYYQNLWTAIDVCKVCKSLARTHGCCSIVWSKLTVPLKCLLRYTEIFMHFNTAEFFFFFFEYWVLKWRYHFYCNFVSQICKNSLWERNCQWKELCIVIFCETFWFIFKYIHTIPCFLLFFFSHQYIQSWALIQTGFQQVPFSFGLKFWHLKRFV